MKIDSFLQRLASQRAAAELRIRQWQGPFKQETVIPHFALLNFSPLPLPRMDKVDLKYKERNDMKFSDLIPPQCLNIVFGGKGATGIPASLWVARLVQDPAL